MRTVNACGFNKKKLLLCTTILSIIMASVIVSSNAYASKSFFKNLVGQNKSKGYWLGKGSIMLKGGESEALKCRATYFLAENAASLKQNLRCASTSYNIVAKSNYQSNKNTITGQWTEETFEIKGAVSGKVRGNKLTLAVKGQHIDADMTIILKRCTKQIQIIPKEGSAVKSISMKFGRC